MLLLYSTVQHRYLRYLRRSRDCGWPLLKYKICFNVQSEFCFDITPDEHLGSAFAIPFFLSFLGAFFDELGKLHEKDLLRPMYSWQ